MKTLAMTEACKNVLAFSDELAAGETVMMTRHDGDDMQQVSVKEVAAAERHQMHNQKIERLLSDHHALMVELADR
ncbi:type II toxin-antitoxin system prevent-host-death family antitoxin [Enterobacter sp.]|uniref:type II toxin-antitoxin system prevent-host-death family antitoxin n=1 Tax=Enterobacter sp. TaxID=42895 RepID=UPI00296E8AC5|nr:type II toxin-antitoxin system prevent-host-death family antitoxin [Enterobacter sp.]